MKRIIYIALFLCVFILNACEEESISPPSVFTEQVVLTSGEKVILTGRILSNEDVLVEDHGFQVSETEDFSDILTISLGERSVAGRFISEYSELNIQTDYYVRSFMLLNGETITGNMLLFSTLQPKVLDFSPKAGKRNNRIIIEGVNFTSDAYILWNGTAITPNSIEEESFIELTVPQIGTLPYAIIEVVNQNDTILIDERFEYIIGEWTDDVTLDDPFKNIDHIYFEDESYFYYGLGLSTEVSGPSNKLFRLDKETYERTLVPFLGQTPVDAFYTNDGYFGSGSVRNVINGDLTLDLLRDFYKYENSGIVQLSDIPVALYKAAAISTEDAIYVYGGETVSRELNTAIFKYTKTSDSWNEIGDSPMSLLNDFPYFSIGDNHYFIEENSTMMSYNVNTQLWTERAAFPNDVQADGVAIELNGFAYVGLQDITRRIFEYLPTEDRWRNMNTVSDINPSLTLGSWTHNDKVNVMRVNFGDGEDRFIWTLDPFAF